jgi:hypothetical protein
MTIQSKLRRALQSTPLLERDEVTAELALVYARQLDRLFVRLGEDEAVESPTHHKRVITEIDIIGRRLEATLDRLGMSPGARPAVRGGGEGTGGDPASAALDQLRGDVDTGAAGVDYAEAVDPAVTAADAGN